MPDSCEPRAGRRRRSHRTQSNVSSGTLIVGAGQAGVALAGALRAQGYRGPITLVGSENYAPYHRPPLSKGFLLGKVDIGGLYIRSDDYFRSHDIRLVTGESVAAIDLAALEARSENGSSHRFDRLVLATGVEPIRLAVPGSDLPGVMYLGCLRDAIALKARLSGTRKLLVVGGGYIGL